MEQHKVLSQIPGSSHHLVQSLPRWATELMVVDLKEVKKDAMQQRWTWMTSQLLMRRVRSLRIVLPSSEARHGLHALLMYVGDEEDDDYYYYLWVLIIDNEVVSQKV